MLSLVRARLSVLCCTNSMLAARLAGFRNVIHRGGKVRVLTIAREMVPVVLHRPEVLRIGVLTSAVIVMCNAPPVHCMLAEDYIDQVMQELLTQDAAAPAVSDDDSEPPSDDEESIDEEEPEADQLSLGPAKHDLLGPGTIIVIHDSEKTLDGVEIAFDSNHAGKVLFKFKKKEGRKTVEKQRWVFADACERVREETGGSSSAHGSGLTAQPDAFEEMAQSATSARAFTQGMDTVELAAHERRRKLQNLKDAPVQGHNKSGRQTKEPKVDPQERVDDE